MKIIHTDTKKPISGVFAKRPKAPSGHTIAELWQPSCYSMIVRRGTDGAEVMFDRGSDGKIDAVSGVPAGRFTIISGGKRVYGARTAIRDTKRPIWTLVDRFSEPNE